MSKTRTTATSQATQRTRQLFQWLNQIKVDRLPPSAFLVAFEISQAFNLKREGADWCTAWRGYKSIADAIGMCEANVIKVVRRLEARGHLEVDWGSPGRGHPNQYRMVRKPDPREVLQSPGKPHPSSTKPHPSEENYVFNHRASSEEEALGESRAHARATTLNGGAGAAAFQNEVERKRVAEGWRSLRSIWIRPWPDDAAAVEEAEETYIAACSQIAPEDLVVAAEAWTGAVEARFLPPLAKWLAGRGWDKPPPQRKPQRQNGHRYGKPDLFTAGLIAGGYHEDENGEPFWPYGESETVP